MTDFDFSKIITSKIDEALEKTSTEFALIKEKWEDVLQKWNDQNLHDHDNIKALNEDAKTFRSSYVKYYSIIKYNILGNMIDEYKHIYSEHDVEIKELFNRIWNDKGLKPTITGLKIHNIEYNGLDLSCFKLLNFTIFNTTLNNAQFYDCEFRKSDEDIIGAFSWHCNAFNKVNFNGSIIKQELALSQFNDCKFYNTRIIDTSIIACSFNFCEAHKIEVCNVKLGRITDTTHSHSSIGFSFAYKITPNYFSDTDFSSGSFIKSSMKGLKFEKCGFEYAIIENSDFFQCELDNIKMNHAKITNSKFNKSIITNVDLRSVKEFKENHLGDAVFSNVLFAFQKISLPIPEEKEKEYRRAEIVYRSLKQSAHLQGEYGAMRAYSIKEARMITSSIKKLFLKEKSFWKKLGLIFRWFIRWLFGILSDYGEKPERVFGWSIILIILSAFIYSLSGIGDYDEIVYGISCPFSNHDWMAFLKICYFSTITFTTVGYGDLHPIGAWAYIWAMVESFLGVFAMGLFVVSMSKRIGTR